ncbi:myelin-associated glycoprotein-like [Pagrus major]|uniref:myelin-associated glycoprotein-like n=1 Tax=Pagrus major TaxID=143350 RepID=UPI003CC8892E
MYFPTRRSTHTDSDSIHTEGGGGNLSDLGHIQESLQENQDRTKVKTSVLTFTASRLHHRLEISCTAVYNKQDGSSQSVSTNLTADISCPLCGQFNIFMPQTIEVLSGSCVTIPCFFDVEDKYESNVDETCRAVWKNDQGTVVFDSSNPQTTGHLTGNLKNRDCTTTLNNMRPENSKEYYLRLQCNQFGYNFRDQKLHISVTDDPPTPTLTPSTLKVEEGTSVSLKCSAPAPCLSHPPTLTWSSSLGHIQESLQENQDRTKVKTSVLTFTASHLHHGLEISCTAVYNKQDGSSQSVSTSLTADISYPPKITTVSVSPSGPVPENSSVTLTCSSSANPAVRSYTWYRADGGQEVIGTGNVLNIAASEVSGPFFCKTENDRGAGKSNTRQFDVQLAPQILSSYDCIQTADQLNCSCETVGNPPPALQWYLDGLPVNHSDRFAISSEPLNISGLRSIITESEKECEAKRRGQNLHVIGA